MADIIRRKTSSRRGKNEYITLEDCPSEPDIIKAYCDSHSQAFCIGGYTHMGCRPEKSKREQFIKYDLESGQYKRSDGTVIPTTGTYCGRPLLTRIINGRSFSENQIWNRAGLGMPDLRDGNTLIEAKGGLPTISKVHTALGQLLMYRAHDPDLKMGFLFPKIWMEAESIQRALQVVTEHGIILIPI
jgi:hypothetical protein